MGEKKIKIGFSQKQNNFNLNKINMSKIKPTAHLYAVNLDNLDCFNRKPT